MSLTVLLIVFILALIGADQLVKYWAVHELLPVGTMKFIHFGNFRILDLTYLENDGAIFGSMSGQRWFLIGFTALVLIGGTVYLFANKRGSKFLNITLAMFIAGGFGNLVDRIRQGYVVDMFEVKLFKFAIFNVADIYVTCAFVMLIVYGIFLDKSANAKAAANVAADSKGFADDNE